MNTGDFITERQRHGPRNNMNKRKPIKKDRKCFVCNKPGCWSTNHTMNERLAALRYTKRYRAFLVEEMKEMEEEKNVS